MKSRPSTIELLLQPVAAYNPGIGSASDRGTLALHQPTHAMALLPYRIAQPATLLVLLGLMPAASSVAATTLARAGRPAATIVIPAEATPVEQTAAQEIAHYVGRISGAELPIQREGAAALPGPRVFVGSTTFARTHGFSPDPCGPEEWLVRSIRNDLVILGGEPRGTLYGAYRFLEDHLGVHWWNPFEEGVPQRPTLRLGTINRRGKPAIPYRDIYMLYGRDGGRFAARNRLNRHGDAPITAAYGGSRDYGPPYHVHTFNLYFPPSEYFSQHPEWYSLRNGQRASEGGQLCLTDPQLRKAFLEKLRSYLRTSGDAAKATGTPPPLVFSISQNDCLNPCECERCQAIARAEESECGPLLEFVNYLADGIKDEYPSAYLDTLAYQYTQRAPKTIRPRDNVIVRLCDTDSDPTQPITSEANRAFRQHLSQWAQIAKNLRIWDYAVTYANPIGLPMPTAQTYGPDYRFYLSHHVEGVFTELEYEILADMRDFKVWLMMKQLEDPHADYAGLVRTFTDGFYGPAGAHVRQYLVELQQEATTRQTRCNWNSTPTSLTYLNLDFVTRAHQRFDEAERAVAEDPIWLRRVRHARLPLDRATLALHARLASDWLARGKPAALVPPDRESTGRRVLDTWLTQAKLRLPESAQASERQNAEAEVRRYVSLPNAVALPGKFRAHPKGTVHDYLATMTRNWADVVQVIKDAEAESGIANRLDLGAANVESPEKYGLPMPWGVYGTVEKKGVGSGLIRPDDIPGPGYHWYHMGSFPIAPGNYVYFFWSWIIQVDVDSVFDPTDPGRRFDIWARVKFTGPRFPHARPGDPDAIYVERLVLVKTEP